MIIKKLNNGHIKVTCENQIEEAFWKTIKHDRAYSEALIKQLKNEVKILRQDNSYYKKVLKENKIKG